ncbi:MAG: hypothetical protein KTR30_01740 [Saprospiraceae bacterium]|nr:hypothetical protein [Saprospiraceae bacterium]
MHLKKTLLLIASLFSAAYLSAQQITIPQLYEDKIGKQTMESTVDFYTYRYTSNKIDLRTFKKIHPNLDAPDFLEIQAPDLSENKGSMVLLGLLDNGKDGMNSIVIWVAANYFNKEVTFFVDPNMDRNYYNDGPAIILKPGQRKQKIKVMPNGDEALARELFLQVPRDRAKLLGYGDTRLKKRKINNQLAIGIHAGFGSGSLEYDYDNLDTGFPTWYNVNVTEKNVGLNLTYNFSKFILGINATYQNTFFYTSYLNVRVDNPELRIDPNSGREILIDNVDIDRNKDIHAKNRLQWGLMAGYRFHLGNMEVQPLVIAGMTTYLPGRYTPDFSFEEQVFNYGSNPFLEGGIRAEFATGNGGAFFLGVHANHTWWEPEGYFESLNQKNLNIRFMVWKGVLGYRMAIQ